MPDREQRFAAMLDAVDAVTDGTSPRILDLAGGTGTITLRTLARFPSATATVLDQDPVLLEIARSTVPGTVVDADLSTPKWIDRLPGAEFDAVLTATALHWLPADRVAALYAEVRTLLRPGGLFANADHMPDDALPGLSERLRDRARERRDARYATGAATSWTDWWKRVGDDETLAPRLAERKHVYPSHHHSAEWTPPVSWHVEALRAAGYSEAGVLWRGGTDAAVAGVR